jgi:uncharacterized protein involved in exopolysaccharide biosynthesis
LKQTRASLPEQDQADRLIVQENLAMTGSVENLILEQLRALRNQIDNLRTEMRTEFAEVKHRLTSLEASTARSRGDSA